MKKVILLTFICLLVAFTFYWFLPVVQYAEFPVNTDAKSRGIKDTVSNVQTHQTDTTLVTSKSSKNAKDNNVEKKELSDKDALTIAKMLLSRVYNSETIDFNAEKELLTYLKTTNKEVVYQFIVEKLQSAIKGNKNDDILIEYTLSLLVAIDTQRASEVFFGFVAEDDWQGSRAIYNVKKSIEKLNRGGQYTALAQQAFTIANEENPFIGELATTIARHAEAEQIEYLFGYIDEKYESKHMFVKRAMNTIHDESLVPHIAGYLKDNSTANIKNTVLNTLANMGQYEATAALIKWSSTQSKSSAEQVEKLFDIAVQRSPSTKRAIEKELHIQSFVSSEVKLVIANAANKKTLKQ